MHVRCEHCGLDVEAPSGSVGKKLRCPQCGGVFTCALPKAAVVSEDEPGPAEELLLEDRLEETEPAEAAMELAEQISDEPAPPAQPLSADEALSGMARDRPEPVVQENPRHWYVLVSGVAAVALTYEELRAKAAAGAVTAKTKLFYAPKELALRAGDVPGLFADLDARRAEAAKPKPPARRPSPEATATAADAAAALNGLGGDEASAAADGEPGKRKDEDAASGQDAADAVRRLSGDKPPASDTPPRRDDDASANR